MDFIKRNSKRIATDAAGYLLLLLAVLTGWIPGPGGVPLALAGLGLLSINNAWARKLRDYLLHNSNKLAQFLFPANRFVQLLYDVLTFVLLAVVIILEIDHDAIWKVSLGIFLFCFAAVLALLNRGRLARWRNHKHKQL